MNEQIQIPPEMENEINQDTKPDIIILQEGDKVFKEVRFFPKEIEDLGKIMVATIFDGSIKKLIPDINGVENPKEGKLYSCILPDIMSKNALYITRKTIIKGEDRDIIGRKRSIYFVTVVDPATTIIQ